jgi:PPOX class probable F420-dependent enzyme
MANNEIPQNYMDLFQKKAFGHLATLMPDGSPQITPVWVEYDGKYVLVNTTKGRKKLENIKRDPRVAIEIADPDNPYRYMQIRGRVAEITEEGAEKLIDDLSLKYRGITPYPSRKPGMVRVTLKIEPERVLLYP